MPGGHELPRKPLPRASREHSAKFRRAVQAALEGKGLTLQYLGTAIDSLRPEHQRNIDERTLRRYVRSDEPLSRKVISLLFAACGRLGIVSAELVAAINEIIAKDAKPAVIIVPRESRSEIAAMLATRGTQKLDLPTSPGSDGRKKRFVPGLGTITVEGFVNDPEIFLVPSKSLAPKRKKRRTAMGGRK